jgi:hypothetical protein
MTAATSGASQRQPSSSSFVPISRSLTGSAQRPRSESPRIGAVSRGLHSPSLGSGASHRSPTFRRPGLLPAPTTSKLGTASSLGETSSCLPRSSPTPNSPPAPNGAVSPAIPGTHTRLRTSHRRHSSSPHSGGTEQPDAAIDPNVVRVHETVAAPKLPDAASITSDCLDHAHAKLDLASFDVALAVRRGQLLLNILAALHRTATTAHALLADCVMCTDSLAV